MKEREDHRLIQLESLPEYFRKALGEAISRTNAQLSPEIQVYLIRMLLDFTHSEQAFSGVSHGEKPVYSLMLARALDSDSHEALRLYKQVGDSTLYHLGFFRECALERGVNESYYQTLGEMAYGKAADLSRPLGVNATLIYAQLAHQFPDLVSLFNDVALYGERNQETGKVSTNRLLLLIETYKRNHNPRIREILVQHGVQIEPEPKKS